MNKTKTSMMVAGGISVLFLLFHLLFPQLFNWKETLTCLNPANWAIFQTYNLVAILMVGTITYFTFRHTVELTETSLGRSLLVVFSLFYLIRTVAQFIYFGFQGISSLVIVILCLAPASIYLWACLSEKYNTRGTSAS
jgi:hypothetical protein